MAEKKIRGPGVLPPMFITADQLLAHMVGDYVLQSDYMATEKTKKSLAALVHAVTYTIPFLFLTQSILALSVILGTHFVIDRWRLARYICWIKNFIGPKRIPVYPVAAVPESYPSTPEMVRNHPWSECSKTGYHESRPDWMSVWLLIIADNALHIIFNGLAIKFL